MDFGFDVSVPEIVEEEYAQPSAFGSFAQEDFKDVKNEQDVVNLTLQLVKLDPDDWMPFLIIHRDLKQRRASANFIYSEESFRTLNEAYPLAKFCPVLNGFDFPTLGRAAATAVSTMVFSDDTGKAKTALDGHAHLENGDWTVDSVRNSRFVVPVTSRQLADLQLFCASVDINREPHVVNVDKRRLTCYEPKLILKNYVERVSIPVEVKRIFQNLLINNTGKPFTNKTIEKAPWIWNAVFQACQDLVIPSDALPLPFIYFKFVKKSFAYAPKACDFFQILYGIYPSIAKELTHHLAKHSVMEGGVFFKRQHFENLGLSFSQRKHIGGEFSAKLCAFNTNEEVTWEKAGAFIENPSSGLGTTIETISPVAEFTGLYWNPVSLNPAQLPKAAGVIIPYDSNRNGSSWLKQWISLTWEKDTPFKIWCHYGPMPALWCEAISSHDLEDNPDAAPYNHVVVETMWKTMGVMALYNFQCSLNRCLATESAKGVEEQRANCLEFFRKNNVPTDPIAVLIADGSKVCKYKTTVPVNGVKQVKELIVPKFNHFSVPDRYLPGRWNMTSKKEDEVESLDENWKHFSDFAKAQAAVDPNFKAKPHGEVPSFTESPLSSSNVRPPNAKRAKREEPAATSEGASMETSH